MQLFRLFSCASIIAVFTAGVLLLLVACGGPGQPAALVVNTNVDAVDANLSDGRCDADLTNPSDQCTLRAAITGVLVEIFPVKTQNGNADLGGAILSSGTLTVESGIIFGNRANNGGGVLNQGGIMKLANTHVSNNNANREGGGVQNNVGTMSLTNGTIISGNKAHGASGGGGIFNNGGMLNIDKTSVSDNRAVTDGGGIQNAGNGGLPPFFSPLIMTALSGLIA